MSCFEGGDDELDRNPELDVCVDGGGDEVEEGMNVFLGRMVVDIYVYGVFFPIILLLSV